MMREILFYSHSVIVIICAVTFSRYLEQMPLDFGHQGPVFSGSGSHAPMFGSMPGPGQHPAIFGAPAGFGQNMPPRFGGPAEIIPPFGAPGSHPPRPPFGPATFPNNS